MELLFATHNQHKVQEVSALLASKVDLQSLDDIGFHEDIPETALTIEGNALLKARYIFERTGRNCFADDSGLEVETLGGAPGVHSAYFAGEQRNDSENIQKLLGALASSWNRDACLKTVIALIIDGKETLFEGTISGSIAHGPAGSNGFGYDPIFIPKGYKVTFAQMSPEEKNRISHRALAVGKLVNFLQGL
jgi:XTP/dITP diphosphohydrolase